LILISSSPIIDIYDFQLVDERIEDNNKNGFCKYIRYLMLNFDVKESEELLLNQAHR